MLKASFIIPHAHPALPGHFPDHPITPGVVSLDHVAQNLLSLIPDSSIDGFPQVKFLQPLLPGIEVFISYQAKTESLYQFSCESNGKIILSGQIRLATKET